MLEYIKKKKARYGLVVGALLVSKRYVRNQREYLVLRLDNSQMRDAISADRTRRLFTTAGAVVHCPLPSNMGEIW